LNRNPNQLIRFYHHIPRQHCWFFRNHSTNEKFLSLNTGITLLHKALVGDDEIKINEGKVSEFPSSYVI